MGDVKKDEEWKEKDEEWKIETRWVIEEWKLNWNGRIKMVNEEKRQDIF